MATIHLIKEAIYNFSLFDQCPIEKIITLFQFDINVISNFLIYLS